MHAYMKPYSIVAFRNIAVVCTVSHYLGVCGYICLCMDRFICSTFMYVCTVHALTFARLNFCGMPVFAVCDVTAHLLLVWSKFSQDETFADGY